MGVYSIGLSRRVRRFQQKKARGVPMCIMGLKKHDMLPFERGSLVGSKKHWEKVLNWKS